MVDHHGAVDPHGMEGSGQEVLVGEGRGRRYRVGGTGRGDWRPKRCTKEEKLGTRMPFAVAFPTHAV